MLALLAAAALAAAPEFESVVSRDGCTIFRGPVQEDGTATVRAECAWADVDFHAFEARLAQNDAWHRYLDCLAETRVMADGERDLVWQRQRAPAIAPREDVVWMWTEATATGFRHHWALAVAPFEASEGAVVPLRNEGFWELSPAADGGVLLVNETTYNPGGWLPLALVRQFQASISAGVLANLHEVGRGLRG